MATSKMVAILVLLTISCLANGKAMMSDGGGAVLSKKCKPLFNEFPYCNFLKSDLFAGDP